MEIQLNGSPKRVSAEINSIDQLVRELEFTPQQIAIEQNGCLVQRKLWSQTAVGAGDVIEVVTLVGGG